MDIVNRVQEIIKKLKTSERAFAIKCGLRPTTLDMQLNGNRAISLQTISAILTSLPEISAEWLLRGNGDMVLKPQSPSLDIERIATLVDTIATMKSAINEKQETIDLLSEQVKHLESQISKQQ